MTLQSVNPRTGAKFGPVFGEMSKEEVAKVIARVQLAHAKWSVGHPTQRQKAIYAIADAIDLHVTELVEVADLETGLGKVRLTGEVGRTTFQLRMCADAVANGEYVWAKIDKANVAPLPQGHPELVRTNTALGIVAVFGASNFPFAFSVLGGDTASALAAGCAVIMKVHPAHPQTALRTVEIARAALSAAGFSADILTTVHGYSAGKDLLLDSNISAGAFTGSRSGGRALFDLASSREIPIPFYGELGSVNSVIALGSALDDPTQFASDYVDSLLLGNGQFCTNPSVLYLPEGTPVLDAIAENFVNREAAPFLSSDTKVLHDKNRADMQALLAPRVVSGKAAPENGFYSSPQIQFSTVARVAANLEALNIECFGPTGLVLTYSSTQELLEHLEKIEGALVGSLFADAADPLISSFARALASKVGRVTFNAWPTGVAVTAGQNHGGPYPASTSPLHTSVGTAAIARFLRPVSFQNFPESLLPNIANNI